jgi:hypothetical protein
MTNEKELLRRRGGGGGDSGTRRSDLRQHCRTHGLVLNIRLTPGTMMDGQQSAQVDHRDRHGDEHPDQV